MPVLVLNAPSSFAGSEARDRLAARHELISEVPAEGPFGILAFGKAAPDALSIAGERADAIVLIAPEGLALGDPELKIVKTPKAVLIGTTDARFGKDAVTRHRKGLSHVNVVLVFGAGADIAADRPDAFASAVGDFLSRKERFSFYAESVAIGG